MPPTQFFIPGEGDTVRAGLSERYVAYDNREVVEAVATATSDDRLVVKSFMLEEGAMFLKLVPPTVSRVALQFKAGG